MEYVNIHYMLTYIVKYFSCLLQDGIASVTPSPEFNFCTFIIASGPTP